MFRRVLVKGERGRVVDQFSQDAVLCAGRRGKETRVKNQNTMGRVKSLGKLLGKAEGK